MMFLGVCVCVCLDKCARLHVSTHACWYLSTNDRLPPLLCPDIMDLKVAFVVVCLCALAITSTEAGIPKCCVKPQRHISRGTLLKVERYYEQLSSGACDISALILYVRDRRKPLCVSNKVKRRPSWKKLQDTLYTSA
uniref:Chemokine interleukin-8-like domain-containing protein n=1 Tax=Echeneis naucrates TaxID=173247 RepID=A0A665TIP9_ECHNA